MQNLMSKLQVGQRSAFIIGKGQWFERSIQTENSLFCMIFFFLPNTSQSAQNYHVIHYVLILPPNIDSSDEFPLSLLILW